jgi:hypothetical protein
MDYFRGERVRCLGKAEWGPGVVETDSRDGKVRVLFREAGPKLLCLKHAKLMKVRPIPPPSEGTTEAPRLPLPERIEENTCWEPSPATS